MDSAALDVLLVTAAGQTFAVPAEQVDSLFVYSPTPAGDLEPAASETPSDLGEALGYAAAAPGAGHAIQTRGQAAWLVEAVGDIVSLPWGSLRRLPAALSRQAAPAVWGAAVHNEDVLLLLDLDRLLTHED